MEKTLEDAKENCEHILKVNVAYIERLQVGAPQLSNIFCVIHIR